MSLTAPEMNGRRRVEGGTVDPRMADRPHTPDDDTVVVTCGACATRQTASGRALGYRCHSCGSAWRVLRCRGCSKASLVLEGTTVCPRCDHAHRPPRREARAAMPTWLTEPEPLSVWLGGVKYLGGHVDGDAPVSSAGLLLDRRGIHLRAFSELFSIKWDDVLGIDIEGPVEISERMTTSRMMALGASTWAMQVAYVTIHTDRGDAIFEVSGLGPPQVHARLSRVLQGLQRSDHPLAPIPLERGHRSPGPRPITPAPVDDSFVAPAPGITAPVTPAPVDDSFVAPAAPVPAPPAQPAEVPATADPHTPLTIDPQHADIPLEVLVIDALWKLAHLRDVGLLDESEVRGLRSRLLTRLSRAPQVGAGDDAGPLLHV